MTQELSNMEGILARNDFEERSIEVCQIFLTLLDLKKIKRVVISNKSREIERLQIKIVVN